MEDRARLCKQLVDMELSSVERTLNLVQRTAQKPDDDYLYAQTYESVESTRSLAELRESVCGERFVKEKKK